MRKRRTQPPHAPPQAPPRHGTRWPSWFKANRCIGGARRDRYDRAISQVKVIHGRCGLLDVGRVRVHTWPNNVARAHELLVAGAKARIANKGHWALPAYRVILPFEAKVAPHFAVMEGWVRKVFADRGPLWLDFAEGGTEVKLPWSGTSSPRTAASLA